MNHLFCVINFYFISSSIIIVSFRKWGDVQFTAVLQCYIERALFNKIYEHTLHKQNIGHLLELEKVKRIYQDYFRGHTN